MTEPYFKGIKVGDKVWELNREEPYTVVEIKVDVDKRYLLPIFLSNGSCMTMDGKYVTYLPQCYFWDKVIITPPPRPKRMVEKVVEGYINIYPNQRPYPYVWVSRLYSTREEADRNATIIDTINRLGEAFFIRHIYLVEEEVVKVELREI